MQGHQVFQTASSSRWQRFKWSGRLLLFFAALGITIIIITLLRSYMPAIPPMQQRAAAYKQVLNPNNTIIYKNALLAKKYAGFRKFIDFGKLYNKGGRKAIAPYSFTKKPISKDKACSIRAAFYVAWDPQSFFSLQRNIDKVNLIMPEWMFIDPTADTLRTNLDERAFAVMKKAGVKIVPMLSNFYKTDFNGATVHRIITNPAKKERLINDVLAILQKNKLAGVNVDLENLTEKTDEPFTLFQKELYEKLHAAGFLVTQDVEPFNEDYNYKELANYNDYIFLMAYDQYSDNTAPGPIADQKWIEGAVDNAARQIPSQKVILCLAAYGYDWPKNDQGTTVSYQEALTTAKASGEKIDFDNNSYNLHYSYTDDDKIDHDVYFTDAATAFNSMRFATEYGLGGVALWRLGDEDYRIWEFYNKDMSKQAIKTFDFNAFTSVTSSDDVDYIGDGEILDVKATPTKGRIAPEVDTSEMLISEENYESLPAMFVVHKYGAASPKKLVLTFDDGPDPRFTPKVLDILSKEHVPATFFVVGINAEDNIPIIKRLYNEGHEIGDHTFTHPNIAEVSTKRADIEIESTRLLIECITGHSTILFRAPYNADFEPEKMEELEPVALARTKNFLDVGESIDPEDWEPGVKADTIVQRVIRLKEAANAAGNGGNIILMHDAGGETREETIKALPQIIEYFKKRGYTFTTVADLLGKKKDDLMPPVPKGSGYYLIQLNFVMAELGYWGGHFLFSMFIVFIILSLARILLMAWLSWKQKRLERKEALLLPALQQYPLVSIIVPAYNEEVNAVSSLYNLLKTDYPAFEIIFVDDGSKDATYQKVATAFDGYQNVKVFTKPNGGKASALNFGISRSAAEYVVCIDADTQLKSDAVSQLMKHFLNPSPKGEVGAVAGNVKVGNEVNMLTKWQAIEYISSQNFDRRAFAYLNAITVVPGAIGAFKKEAIEVAGGFTTDTLAEDCDVTIRIIRAGYIVSNETDALAYTEAPENLKPFLKQRFRWSFGVLQTFWKHRDLLFNNRYKWLSWLAMPNILLFQYIIPSVVPIADFFMLIGLLTGNAARILPYYLVFMLVDALVAFAAFLMEGEHLSRLIWIIPQRIVYRWLMWYVLFKSVRRAIKGELQHWGVLKRTGRVKNVQIT